MRVRGRRPEAGIACQDGGGTKLPSAFLQQACVAVSRWLGWLPNGIQGLSTALRSGRDDTFSEVDTERGGV